MRLGKGLHKTSDKTFAVINVIRIERIMPAIFFIIVLEPAQFLSLFTSLFFFSYGSLCFVYGFQILTAFMVTTVLVAVM